MNLEDRIIAFSELGEVLRNSIEGKENKYLESIGNLIINQEKINPWFTPGNVSMALKAIGDELTFENLKKWTDAYPALGDNSDPITVGVVMAGNIPVVGFHDFLSVLISGNRINAKTSSKDAEIIIHLSNILCSINSKFSEYINFTDGFLSGFDSVIATGSDNSSRYFEYYFGKYPHIIRKNRNSIAVIEGNETSEEIENLGTDIFSYFGFGCRNVSKVFLPDGYDIGNIIKNWSGFSNIIYHSKYANNYDYNMAIYLVNKEKFLDTGFILLKESRDLSSPVSVLYYEYYNPEDNLKDLINIFQDKIQCICGRNYVPFGKSQFPKLWDYADNLDTLDFLLKKKLSGIL
jgi:hypothetical protein